MYHSRDPSEGNTETMGNCNLKDKVVVWEQYRKRRGSRRSSDRELDSLGCKTKIPGAVAKIKTRKALKANTTKAKSITKKILQTKGKKYWKYWPWRYTCMWPKRMSNTWEPKKSRLQNEILTASIAQESEEDGNKNRTQKGSGERQWRNKGKGERVRRE